MTIDLKAAALGFVLGLMVWGVWHAGKTQPAIDKLVEEKAQAIRRGNDQEQETAKYKAAAEHWFAVANAQPQAVPQDPTVGLLNTVRPGLGTAVVAVGQAWQQHQAQKAAQEQAAVAQQQAEYASALERQKTELHCLSKHCAACDAGWRLFSTGDETYCVKDSQ